MGGKIVEAIPDMSEWPDWAVEGFRSGDFFRRAITLMEEKDEEILNLQCQQTDILKKLSNNCGSEFTYIGKNYSIADLRRDLEDKRK